MLGTLEEEKKKDWQSHVLPLVQAYNSTKHDSTGFSPFFLMFGRHPRLPIDVAFGLQQDQDKSETDYVRSLRERMEFAFDIATKNASTASTNHKRNYDRRIRGSTVEVGDRVLVRNTGVRGKCKLANRWESTPYLVVEQPNSEIPVFVVKPEGKSRVKRTLHRNMLLPINFLPLPEAATPRQVTREASSLPTPALDQVSSGEESEDEYEESLDYVLNPLAQEFIPIPHDEHPSNCSPPATDVSHSGLEAEVPGDDHDPGVEEVATIEEESEDTGSIELQPEEVATVDEETLDPGDVDVERSFSTSSQSASDEMDEEDEHLAEAVDVSPVTPAVRNRPQCDRRPPVRFQSEDWIMHQQSVVQQSKCTAINPASDSKLDRVKSVMELQHKMLFDVLQYLDPK